MRNGELDEEIATHIEMAAEDYRRGGLSPEEARRRALIDFGGVPQAKEAQRDARRFAWAGILAEDIRHALRALGRDAGFTAAALLLLAVGIGANTAVFSIVNSVLLRPLAYGHAGRLVALEEVIPQFAHLWPVMPVNARHYLEWKRNARTVEAVALLDGWGLNLTGAGEPERINGRRATPDLFDVLGVRAQLGRTFTAADVREKVAIVSHPLWRRRFGGVPDVVGKSVFLDGVPYRIIGVLPRGYRDPFESGIDLYVPWEVRDDASGWAGDHNYESVGRLRPGASMAEAVAELNVLQKRIATRFENVGRMDLAIHLTSLQEHVVGSSRLALLTLMGAVAVVLLIGCLNLGNLMLARSVARRREMAVRMALGASVRRLAGAVAVEAALLSSAGAALGVLLAHALLQAFRAWKPAGLARADEVSLDLVAVLFAALLAVLTAALFATLPAWQLRKVDPQDALRASGRSMTGDRSRLRSRELLTGLEVGLSVALLVLAGLLVRSAVRLDAVERGFDASHVLTAGISLPETGYQTPELRRRFFDSVLNALRHTPGVLDAGVISRLPLRGQRWSDAVTAEGDVRPIAEQPILSYRPITDGYFRAMGIPLIAGRTMMDSDHPRLAAVLSARAAARVWPGQNAIGKRFRRGDPKSPWFEVVGISGDVRGAGLDQAPDPLIYVPLWARTPTSASLAIRTAGDPSAAVALLRKAVAAADPQIPVDDVRTMSEIERRSTANRRFVRNLILAFACVALWIAALGTYSVLAWSAARRTTEIGIRIALGADPAKVRGMIFRQGLRPVLIGLAGGLVVAWLAGRALSTLLFQVGPRDALTYILVAAITLAAAASACWFPANRASRVAPLEALREE